jgi:hypothetical protein
MQAAATRHFCQTEINLPHSTVQTGTVETGTVETSTVETSTVETSTAERSVPLAGRQAILARRRR